MESSSSSSSAATTTATTSTTTSIWNIFKSTVCKRFRVFGNTQQQRCLLIDLPSSIVLYMMNFLNIKNINQLQYSVSVNKLHAKMFEYWIANATRLSIRTPEVESLRLIHQFKRLAIIDYKLPNNATENDATDTSKIMALLVQCIQNNRLHLKNVNSPPKLATHPIIYLSLSACPNLERLPECTASTEHPYDFDGINASAAELARADLIQLKQEHARKITKEDDLRLILMNCKKLQNLDQLFTCSIALGKDVLVNNVYYMPNARHMDINWLQIPKKPLATAVHAAPFGVAVDDTILPLPNTLKWIIVSVGHNTVNVDTVHEQVKHLLSHLTCDLPRLSLYQHEEFDDEVIAYNDVVANTYTRKAIEECVYDYPSIKQLSIRLHCPFLPILKMPQLHKLSIDQVHVRSLFRVFYECPLLKRLNIGRIEGWIDPTVLGAASRQCKHIQHVRIERCQPSTAADMIYHWADTLTWLKVGIIVNCDYDMTTRNWTRYLTQTLRNLRFLSIRLLQFNMDEDKKDPVWGKDVVAAAAAASEAAATSSIASAVDSTSVTEEERRRTMLGGVCVNTVDDRKHDGTIFNMTELETLHCQNVPEDELTQLRFPNLFELALLDTTQSITSILQLSPILGTLYVNNSIIKPATTTTASTTSTSSPQQALQYLRLGAVSKFTMVHLMSINTCILSVSMEV